MRENEEICKANSHLTFVSIPDFHWAFDDYGYSRQENHMLLNSGPNPKKITKNLDTDAYDDIFIFRPRI